MDPRWMSSIVSLSLAGVVIHFGTLEFADAELAQAEGHSLDCGIGTVKEKVVPTPEVLSTLTVPP